MIEIEPVRIAYVAIILLSAFLLGRLIKRGKLKLLEEASAGKLLLRSLESTGLYIVAIVLSLWVLDIFSLWPMIESQYPLAAKGIMLVTVWVAAIYIVRIFSDVYKKIDDVAKKRTKGIPHEVNVLVQKLFKYAVYIVAALWSLTILGIAGAIEGMLVGAGFAGIVIGFAAQQTISNLLAGISLMLDRPFRIGDWIHLKNSNLVGRVDEISLRSTTITSPDNTPICLPNSTVANEAIVNYTTNKQRRFFLDVSISYESDVAKAIKIIKETLEKDPATAKEKSGNGYFAPLEIVVDSFAASSVNLQAKVFVDSASGGGIFQTKSRMLENIKANLTKAGIEIPYPRQYVIMDKDQKRKRKK